MNNDRAILTDRPGVRYAGQRTEHAAVDRRRDGTAVSRHRADEACPQDVLGSPGGVVGECNHPW